MQKFEIIGMLAAIALMAVVVVLSWPGKRPSLSPHHAIARIR